MRQTQTGLVLPKPEPDSENIYSLAKQFRSALMQVDDAARAQMLSAYQPLYARLLNLLADLMQFRAEAQSAGLETNANWLYKQRRYEILIAQVERDMTAFGQTATELVKTQQQQAVTLAAQDATSLIAVAAPSRSEVAAVLNRLPSDELKTLVGFLQNGSALETLTKQYAPQMSGAVKDTLIAGFALGKNARTIGKAIETAAGVPLDRAVLLARTETLRAYRETSINRYAKSGYVEKWQWCATLTRRTCPVCIAMHGTIHDLSETFASHPACRCTPLPVLIDEEPPITETGVGWFARQSDDTQFGILKSDSLHAAYKAGDFDLPQIVGYDVDEDWGPRRFRRSVAEALSKRQQ